MYDEFYNKGKWYNFQGVGEKIFVLVCEQGRAYTSGNHLAKILAKKCSGKLHEVTERLKRDENYLKKKRLKKS